MANYNFTMEQLETAKAAKSPEELVAKAKEQGIDITPEQAAAFLDEQTTELADEELDNVAGGGCGDPSEQELKWAAEAKAEGRMFKYVADFARDICPKCSKLASVYARSKEKKKSPPPSSGGITITVNEYHDCKCYACMTQFDVLIA